MPLGLSPDTALLCVKGVTQVGGRENNFPHRLNITHMLQINSTLLTREALRKYREM